MIPTGGRIGRENVRRGEQPSRTWRIDWDNGRIAGTADGRDAVLQAVAKIMQTERYLHVIYDADYGVELATLIGRDPVLIRSELKRRIAEALTQDDRITGVDDFDIRISGDNATARFTVASVFGTFRQEVTVNV